MINWLKNLFKKKTITPTPIVHNYSPQIIDVELKIKAIDVEIVFRDNEQMDFVVYSSETTDTDAYFNHENWVSIETGEFRKANKPFDMNNFFYVNNKQHIMNPRLPDLNERTLRFDVLNDKRIYIPTDTIKTMTVSLPYETENTILVTKIISKKLN